MQCIFVYIHHADWRFNAFSLKNFFAKQNFWVRTVKKVVRTTSNSESTVFRTRLPKAFRITEKSNLTCLIQWIHQPGDKNTRLEYRNRQEVGRSEKRLKERTDMYMAKNLSRMTKEAEQKELRLRDDMEKLRIQ